MYARNVYLMFSQLVQMQLSYKPAMDEWSAAIRREEALAPVNHNVAEVDELENAGFHKEDVRKSEGL